MSTMDVNVNESSRGFRAGFLSTLNRSFRLSSGKSRNTNSSPIGVMSLANSLEMPTSGLNSSNDGTTTLRPLEIVAPRIDTYRFSMANLEETQDADLDAILGELCALDSEYDEEISRVSSGFSPAPKNNSESSEMCPQRVGCHNKECGDAPGIARTDSPDNDSAFSDTVSMLSSESSASSSASSKCKALKLNLHQDQKDASFQQKADKIKLALERMREANIKKLFIKAFSMDGSSKSLLVDEKMTCGYVARLLADKNHVTMEPKWAIVEHLPDLHMERVYEDHEMLVDNLMLWTRESKNKILFAERPDKISLFQTPEKFLLTEDDRGWSSEHDEHSRHVIIEEFFGQGGGGGPCVAGHPVPPMEGHLYLKSDSRKGWKQFFFVLRPSGLYYSPKEKAKTLKELVCLATFDTNEVYTGVSWKKKYKAPTDYCFAIKHPRLQQPKSVKFIKFLCADDQQTLERWITAMRIAKHGRQLLENHRSLVEELTQEDLDHLAHARSCSITSIPCKTSGNAAPTVSSPAQSNSSSASVANSDTSSGRHSRASSSSSSGCLSDGGTVSESGFDCEFPMGTIKRKPSMKPNLPLTWMTRQLKEMAEKEGGAEEEAGSGGDGGTLTRRPRPAATPGDDSTLKRHHAHDSTDGSIYSNSSNSLSTSSPSRVPSASPVYGHYEPIARDTLYRSSGDNASLLYGYATIYESLPRVAASEELPPPPPPLEDAPDAMFSSTLSLESLPPPPPPPDPLDDVAGSQLSLPPPPPDLAPINLPALPTAAYGACLLELQNKKLSNGASLPKPPFSNGTKERTGSIKKVNFADDPPNSDTKKTKKITFNLNAEVLPASPRKPLPPKRNESTRLSSPKKLADSTSNPPKEFLKDLQRVMRKKWQVAQKCKLEPETTPHEVLGFREYPLSEDYKEASVSMWVHEHYGSAAGSGDPFYENVFGREGPGAAPRRDQPVTPAPALLKKRPPPAPPRRADSTHLSTHHHAHAQPTA